MCAVSVPHILVKNGLINGLLSRPFRPWDSAVSVASLSPLSRYTSYVRLCNLISLVVKIKVLD